MNEPRNPFLQNLKIEYVIRSSSLRQIGNKVSKETIDRYHVEKAEKASVYNDVDLKAWIPQLKICSMHLFMYLVFNIRWGHDRINLDREKFMTWAGISSLQTFYTAKDELVNAGVIAQYKKSEYWINPAFIFKGDRYRYASANGVLTVLNGKKEKAD